MAKSLKTNHVQLYKSRVAKSLKTSHVHLDKSRAAKARKQNTFNLKKVMLRKCHFGATVNVDKVVTIAEHACDHVLKRILKLSAYRLQIFLVTDE